MDPIKCPINSTGSLLIMAYAKIITAPIKLSIQKPSGNDDFFLRSE